MHFPFEFVKPAGYLDAGAGFINLAGSSAIVAVGGISLGTIAYLGLKALGFSIMATTIATAIPVTIGAIGIVGIIYASVFIVSFLSIGTYR